MIVAANSEKRFGKLKDIREALGSEWKKYPEFNKDIKHAVDEKYGSKEAAEWVVENLYHLND